MGVGGRRHSTAMHVPVSSVGNKEEEGPRWVRKPYTITKSRKSWTDPEHDKFLEAAAVSRPVPLSPPSYS